MICLHCAKASSKKTTQGRKAGHARCMGKSWCDCQHRVEEVKGGNSGQARRSRDDHKV